MWFPTPEESLFSNSSALGQIERLYLACSGIEEVLYAAILCRIGAIDGKVTQLALPEDGAIFPVLSTLHLEEWKQSNGGVSIERQSSPYYSGLDWWTMMKRAASEIEARHEPLLGVGKILYQSHQLEGESAGPSC